MAKQTLDEMLDRWTVYSPDEWENGEGPKGWWAVAEGSTIVAYICEERDAFRYRLDRINQALNG